MCYKETNTAKNEVAYDATNYFIVYNVFECGGDILDRLDVSYERACVPMQSTISDCAYFNSDEQVDAIINSK